MTQILNKGLLQLDKTLLSTSFQTAYNLSILPESITLLIQTLTQSIHSKIKSTFDLNSLSKQSNLQDQTHSSSFVYKSRSRTEPTLSNHSSWTTCLWTRLESLIDDLTSTCIKVYTLEKVLEWKKTSSTMSLQVKSFLDEVVEKDGGLDGVLPRTVFWRTVCVALEKESREACRGSNFINQTLTSSYPKLLRLLHDFFSRISLHTHTTYSSSTQSPETILMLRSISAFETVYLERSKQRMMEGLKVLKSDERFGPVVLNELDVARFDPLLIRLVVKNLKEVLDEYLIRISDRIDRDQYSVMGLGSNLLNGSKSLNIESSNLISNLIETLNQVMNEYESTNPEISQTLQTMVNRAEATQKEIIDPMIRLIKREISVLVGRMHSNSKQSRTKPDSYLSDLMERISRMKSEIGHEMKSEVFIYQIVSYTIRCGLFHLSLRDGRDEKSRLGLISEVSELEIGLTQWIEEDEVRFGRDLVGLVGMLRDLREFKRVIFMFEIGELEKEIGSNGEGKEEEDEEFRKMIVLQHLLSRASVQVQRVLGWNEVEYWKWLEEHLGSIEDWKSLVKRVLQEIGFGDQKNEKNGNGELDLVRKVLGLGNGAQRK
ncbi:uncharacterized protein MELLADRAFT_117446 [Melampsora larici-populina 98AG31]|uniref:Conserved oligomeric Golgi complex subunit 5 helical domain-containing protein n=1 Tax=Melampsora larici-populina (strain 98AG31 / pathotype 3-4-7) TaxID=747676 RepID=F4RX84_MELLP|nr:uncharacterized protein MELLADRAFT_117446 [Melampsora larici-populina 98AG31]EGG02923.1 hypothetical protein MELLADRAFT_117446 [Melampsora larici-populina 98AG31]